MRYEKRFMKVKSAVIKRIASTGDKKAYWASISYRHTLPVPGAPAPIQLTEEGTVTAIITWTIDNVDFNEIGAEGVPEDEIVMDDEKVVKEDDGGDIDDDFFDHGGDIDFDALFGPDSGYFDQYDDDFCDGERN